MAATEHRPGRGCVLPAACNNRGFEQARGRRWRRWKRTGADCRHCQRTGGTRSAGLAGRGKSLAVGCCGGPWLVGGWWFEVVGWLKGRKFPFRNKVL